MTTQNRVSIEIECRDCNGVALRGPIGENVGIVCTKCNGSGKETLVYTPFTGIKRRYDIESVGYASGVTKQDPQYLVPYEDFINGKLPRT